MDVEFVLRSDSKAKSGGDVLQAERYRELLVARGLSVSISQGLPQGSGLCHLFNIDRPAEILRSVRTLRGRPYVVSPIHHSRDHVQKFYNVRRGLLGVTERILPQVLVEIAKDLARQRKAEKPLRILSRPAIPSRGALSGLLHSAAQVLVLSNQEGTWLAQDFGYRGKSMVLPNGVEVSSPNFVERDLDVLVVGRIEERKNQLEVARSLAKSNFSAIFVGAGNPTSRSYVREFERVVAESPNLGWRGHVKHDDVRSMLQRTKVSVSASYFEVLSLADLEAFASGCRVLASTCGSTLEFLGDQAKYLSPFDVATDLLPSIETILADTAVASRSLGLPSWDDVGDRLLDVYRAAV